MGNINLNKERLRIIKKFVNIPLTDIRILILIRNNYLSVEDLKKLIVKNRTTIQKRLTQLEAIGLVEKRQINLKRGYKFVFISRVDILKSALLENKALYEKNKNIIGNYKKK